MRRSTWFPVLVAVLGVLSGCASAGRSEVSDSAEPRQGSSPYALSLKQGEQLDGKTCSGGEVPCPDGQMCARLNLGEEAPSRCVDLRTICDRFECGEDRQCVVLESYPPQIQCASRR